jgi:hypothetical protein
MIKNGGVPECIENLSGAKHLLVRAVKYKRKNVLIGQINMPEEK